MNNWHICSEDLVQTRTISTFVDTILSIVCSHVILKLKTDVLAISTVTRKKTGNWPLSSFSLFPIFLWSCSLICISGNGH